MPERDDAEDLGSTFQALPVFRTLRTNLALFSSFARRSGLEPANYSGDDLEFLGIEQGENQLKAHNGAIGTIPRGVGDAGDEQLLRAQEHQASTGGS